MATTKKATFTTAKAYDVFAKLCEDYPEQVMSAAKALGYDFPIEDISAKAGKLVAAAAKVASRPKTETPAQRQRKANAAKVLQAMKAHPEESVTLKEIQNIADYVSTTQGAVSIVNLLTAEGSIRKAEDKKDGHTAYVLA